MYDIASMVSLANLDASEQLKNLAIVTHRLVLIGIIGLHGHHVVLPVVVASQIEPEHA